MEIEENSSINENYNNQIIKYSFDMNQMDHITKNSLLGIRIYTINEIGYLLTINHKFHMKNYVKNCGEIVLLNTIQYSLIKYFHNHEMTNYNCLLPSLTSSILHFLKYGLDGQARLNHQIFNGKQNNFSVLTKMDNELTKVEKYTSDKTLYKITNDYLENNSNNKQNINNDIKLNNHKISNTCTSDILNINKIPDISTSFNDMLNEKSFNNYLSNDLLNNNSLTLNNNICKPIDDIQLLNNKVNNSNILMDNQYKTYPLCRI